MSGSKYFVYGERWRELDTETGSVAGWGRKVHFLYVRGGRLRVAKRRRVLAALQLHAACRPSAISLGSRLSVLSNERRDGHTYKKWSTPPLALPAPQPVYGSAAVGGPLPNCGRGPSGHAAQCCTHYARCDHDCMGAAPREVSPRRGAPRAPINNNNVHQPTDKPCNDKLVNNKQKTTGSQFVSLLRDHTVTKKPSLERDSKGRFIKSKEKQVNTVKSKKEKENDRQNDSSDDDSDSSDSQDLCKELTIPDSDVRALRSYVARTRRDALVRFDADNEYKLALFYAINPLVYVERCAKTERAIRERLPMALAPFAARLGLTPSPNPGTEGAQPNRRLRTKIHQEKLISSSNKYIETSSDSDSEDFQKTKTSKSYNNLTASKDVNNQNRKNNAMNNVKNDYIKNKNVNMQKKSNKDSNTDFNSKINKYSSMARSRSTIHKRRNKSSSDSTDSDSSASSDSDRKIILPQSKRKKHESSNDDTSESDKKSNKNREKYNKQDTDSDSDSETEKENKRSSLRNINIKQKRHRRDSSSDRSHTDDNNARKKAKTERHNNSQTKAPTSPHSRTNPLRKVRQDNQLVSDRQIDTHIIHDSDSEDDRESNKNELNPSNKQTKLNKNRNKTKESRTDSDSDFKTNKRATEKLKRSSLRKISILSSKSRKSDDLNRKTPDSTSSDISDSDSLKENKQIRSILRKPTIEKESSTDSGSENTSTESEAKMSKNNKNRKVQDSDSNSGSNVGKENKRNNSLKRNRRDSDENRRNSLRKKPKIQKTNVEGSNDNHIKRNPLESNKSQAKTNRLNADKEIAQQQILISNYVKNKNNREFRKENDFNTDEKSFDSHDISDQSRSKRDILRKRYQTEEIRKDNADKVKTPSDRKDNSGKVSSSDRKNHSGKVSSKDRKDNSGKVSSSDRKDHSGKVSSSDRKDHSGKVSSSDRKNHSGKVSSSDRKDHTGKVSSSDRKDHSGKVSSSDRKDHSGKVSSSDRKDHTGKVSSSDRKDHSGKVSSSDRKYHSGKVSSGRREDHSGKEKTTSDNRESSRKDKGSSDRKDNSNKERVGSERKDHSEKEKVTNDRKDGSCKVKSTSDSRDISSKASGRKHNSGKMIACSDRRDNSSKMEASSDKSDNSSKAKASSDRKDNWRKERPTNDRKDNSEKLKPSSDRNDKAFSGSDMGLFRRVSRRASNNAGTRAKRKKIYVANKRTNEYSNLEDHAIVAWVLTGGRARRVNGNQLWKELAQQHHQLTAVSRSWHSLRNRYLRYILPSLGALGLPPGDVSRLRAAAATGEIKAKRQSGRRNSMFREKVVRAAYRPRPPSSTPSHRRRADSSTSSTDGQTRRPTGPRRRSVRSVNTPTFSLAPGTSTPTSPPRMRRLFNPKIVHDELNSD